MPNLLTSASFTSGLHCQQPGLDSERVIDGVMCHTCMDIVILMSRTALGPSDPFHMVEDHTALVSYVERERHWHHRAD